MFHQFVIFILVFRRYSRRFSVFCFFFFHFLVDQRRVTALYHDQRRGYLKEQTHSCVQVFSEIDLVRL